MNTLKKSNKCHYLKVINQEDLLKILPFGKTKLLQLLQAGVLPVTKVGRDYITTPSQLQKWLESNEGNEIYYIDK